MTICGASTPSRAITAPVRVAVAGCICAWPTQLDEAIAELDDTRDTAQRELAAIRNHGFARRREAVGDLYSGVPILVASDGNPLHEPAHKLAATLEGFGRISLNVLQVAGERAQPGFGVLRGESVLLAGCEVGLAGLDPVSHVWKGDLKLRFVQASTTVDLEKDARLACPPVLRDS